MLGGAGGGGTPSAGLVCGSRSCAAAGHRAKPRPMSHPCCSQRGTNALEPACPKPNLLHKAGQGQPFPHGTKLSAAPRSLWHAEPPAPWPASGLHRGNAPQRHPEVGSGGPRGAPASIPGMGEGLRGGFVPPNSGQILRCFCPVLGTAGARCWGAGGPRAAPPRSPAPASQLGRPSGNQSD